MPRNVRTARGLVIDFDALIIKQQLAQAPMNIEVERRKKFIDSKEGKVRGAAKLVDVVPVQEPVLAESQVNPPLDLAVIATLLDTPPPEPATAAPKKK